MMPTVSFKSIRIRLDVSLGAKDRRVPLYAMNPSVTVTPTVSRATTSVSGTGAGTARNLNGLVQTRSATPGRACMGEWVRARLATRTARRCVRACACVCTCARARYLRRAVAAAARWPPSLSGAATTEA